MDLLATDASAKRTVAIQVKTTARAQRERGPRGKPKTVYGVEFLLGHKAADHASADFVYVFVDLRGSKPWQPPASYVVPSADVQRYCGTWAAEAKLVRWHLTIEQVAPYAERWDTICCHRARRGPRPPSSPAPTRPGDGNVRAGELTGDDHASA